MILKVSQSEGGACRYGGVVLSRDPERLTLLMEEGGPQMAAVDTVALFPLVGA